MSTDTVTHKGTVRFLSDRFHAHCTCGTDLGEPSRWSPVAYRMVNTHLAQVGAPTIEAPDISRRAANNRRYGVIRKAS